MGLDPLPDLSELFLSHPVLWKLKDFFTQHFDNSYVIQTLASVFFGILAQSCDEVSRSLAPLQLDNLYDQTIE